MQIDLTGVISNVTVCNTQHGEFSVGSTTGIGLQCNLDMAGATQVWVDITNPSGAIPTDGDKMYTDAALTQLYQGNNEYHKYEKAIQGIIPVSLGLRVNSLGVIQPGIIPCP
jgi:hypothetical protein